MRPPSHGKERAYLSRLTGAVGDLPHTAAQLSAKRAGCDLGRLLKLAVQMVERRELSYGYLVAERAD